MYRRRNLGGRVGQNPVQLAGFSINVVHIYANNDESEGNNNMTMMIIVILTPVVCKRDAVCNCLFCVKVTKVYCLCSENLPTTPTLKPCATVIKTECNCNYLRTG